jgi:hypothetical protein
MVCPRRAVDREGRAPQEDFEPPAPRRPAIVSVSIRSSSAATSDGTKAGPPPSQDRVMLGLGSGCQRWLDSPHAPFTAPCNHPAETRHVRPFTAHHVPSQASSSLLPTAGTDRTIASFCAKFFFPFAFTVFPRSCKHYCPLALPPTCLLLFLNCAPPGALRPPRIPTAEMMRPGEGNFRPSIRALLAARCREYPPNLASRSSHMLQSHR